MIFTPTDKSVAEERRAKLDEARSVTADLAQRSASKGMRRAGVDRDGHVDLGDFVKLMGAPRSVKA